MIGDKPEKKRATQPERFADKARQLGEKNAAARFEQAVEKALPAKHAGKRKQPPKGDKPK